MDFFTKNTKKKSKKKKKKDTRMRGEVPEGQIWAKDMVDNPLGLESRNLEPVGVRSWGNTGHQEEEGD